MLRISKLADYGTVVMVYLSKQANNLRSARDIALHTHLSLPTVSKILKRLTRAGLLTSIRGVSGGYRLLLPAHAISVAQIIYALEEYRGFTECSVKPNDCALQDVCTIQMNWKQISLAIETALESVSLDSLAKPNLGASDIARVRQLASGVNCG